MNRIWGFCVYKNTIFYSNVFFKNIINEYHSSVIWFGSLPQDCKLFPCSTQPSNELQLHLTTKYKKKSFFYYYLKLSDVVYILLINVKMPPSVGILTFMSRINSILSWVEHKKSYISSGLGKKNIFLGLAPRL